MAQSRTRTTSLALISLLTLPVHAALAQAELPEIVISAHQIPLEVGKVGSSVTVLRGEELRARGLATAADALRYVPGVTVQASGNGGTFTQVRIRGSEGNEVQVLIDGVPAARLDAGDFDWADFLTDDIDRIEVVRGPQSGLYGANAHAGVISIITKSGRGLARPEVTGRIEGGTRDSHRESLSVRGAAGPLYGAFTVQNRETGGYNIARTGSERDGNRALILTGKGGFDAGNLNVEASVRHVDRIVQFDPELTIPIPDAFARDRFRSTQGRVAATHAAFDGRFVQRIGASWLDQYYNDLIPAFGGAFMTQSESLNADYKGTVKFDTRAFGGELHSLTVVLDQTREHYRNNFGADARRTRHGVAGEHIIEFAGGLTLSGALRHDLNDAFEDVTTWRVTAAQTIAPTATTLHASAGKGVTNPNFPDQFGFFPGFTPNPNLLPESSVGWDAGFEQRWLGGSVVTDVTYFSADFRNKIELMGGTVVNLSGVSPRRGVEVAVKIVPHDSIILDASYTYTDSKLSNGMTAIRRPRHSASANATIFSADRRGRAAVGVVYNGSRQDGDTFFIPGRVDLPGYTIVNAMLSYDLTPHATAYLRAENVFDAQYEEIFSYRAPGFTAYAGLTVKLGDK